MFMLLFAAAITIAVLLWNLFRRFASDNLEKLSDKRRATSRIVSRGEFVDGNRRLEVAMALTDTALYYESAEVHASLDREWIEEVDYDTELSTGRTVNGAKVLRLRCHRQVFEFVIQNDVVLAWKSALPSRRPATDSMSAVVARDMA